MIFKPELVDKIATGRKKMTRRPVKGEQKCRYTVGKDYAVQRRRAGPQVFRIRILAVSRERLGDISPQDAQAEGFKNTDKFFAYWERLYGSVDREQDVWVLSFEQVKEQPEVYMGRKGGYTEIPGLSLEPSAPAVPHTVQERFSKDARDRNEQLRRLRRAERESRPLARRIDVVRREAAAMGIDLRRLEARLEEASSEPRRLEALGAMERKLRSKAA